MTREQFRMALEQKTAKELATGFLESTHVWLFSSEIEYDTFKSRVFELVPEAESVSIVGSGNWRFSLNPYKKLKEFGADSDVDVAVVSDDYYSRTWEEMRRIHRSRWYTLSLEQRERLKRNGENVYSGFISPTWIPGGSSPFNFEFKRILNKLSDESVGYKPVKMLFFRNSVEAVDYYERGFRIAKRKGEQHEV